MKRLLNISECATYRCDQHDTIRQVSLSALEYVDPGVEIDSKLVIAASSIGACLIKMHLRKLIAYQEKFAQGIKVLKLCFLILTSDLLLKVHIASKRRKL